MAHSRTQLLKKGQKSARGGYLYPIYPIPYIPYIPYIYPIWFIQDKGLKGPWAQGARAPFRSLWLPVGHPKLPLAVLWAHLAGLWSRFGALWEPVGSLWAALGSPGLPPFKLEARCSPFAMPVHRIKPPGTRPGSRGSHGSRGSGVKNCGSEPTSTRAGGQDDGS